MRPAAPVPPGCAAIPGRGGRHRDTAPPGHRRTDRSRASAPRRAHRLPASTPPKRPALRLPRVASGLGRPSAHDAEHALRGRRTGAAEAPPQGHPAAPDGAAARRVRLDEPIRGCALRFAHVVARSNPAGTEVFSLGTRMTRLSRALRARDPELALAAAGRAVPDWAGGTRLGETLRAFLDRWGRRGLAAARSW